tara:strand:+ start:13748 stop:16339 length:2592 start_codon:yes stop_codon:yes gene_type:complete
MNANKLRQLYLDFFKNKNHKIVESSPIVTKDDPTLMFTNAGMNQFKDIFLGYTKIKDPRVANTQKCLRVSGKHNDLEEVGHDTYHHTMFEMLGSWSFGDYFKEDAIIWSWEFLTEVCKLDKDRFYVTIYEGSVKDKIDKDNEAFNIWSKLINPKNILEGKKNDNFWEMGQTGPCGPCSEIHYDNRSEIERNKISGASLVNKDHPHVIEIWNLVFMQYNRLSSGELSELPYQHVDTGMGFERLAMITQGVQSNYDTDLFQPIIKKIAKMSNRVYGENEDDDIALRVIADHLRAIVFTISDGQLPSNTKAGYVIRRILRRAVRYGYTFLDLKKPFIFSLVTIIIENYGNQYKELISQEKLIVEVIKKEEESFLITLKQGLDILNSTIKSSKSKKISGEKVFELYDTFGFPVDLTSLILNENDCSFDKKDFEKALQKQKERSKKAIENEKGDWIILDSNSLNSFTGYFELDARVMITRYRKVAEKNKISYDIVFNQTPFYAEGGGQIGDNGIIKLNNKEINILNTIKENNLVIHKVNELPQNLDEEFYVQVNKQRRDACSRNHSATHLLHESLRTILGDHVTQKGSLVTDNNLRFDFSHFSPVNNKALKAIEDDVNKKILENISINEKNISLNEAKNQDIVMLFGEKYDDIVRMIQFNTSKELCGGTHVNSTSEIGLFKIISEGSVSAGTRRIEAITGMAVIKYINRYESEINDLEKELKSKALLATVKQVLIKNKSLEKELIQLKHNNNKALAKDLLASATQIKGIRLIKEVVDLDAKSMKDISFSLKNEKALIALLASKVSGSVILTLMISNDLVAKEYNANNMINILSEHINGSGGGQPFYATAGGKNVSGIANVFENINEMI